MVGHNILEHDKVQSHDVLAPKRQKLNLFDYGMVEHYLQHNRPDLIIHCAGKVGGIQANMQEPFRFLLENLDMGRNVVVAAKRVGIKKLLNLGSSCMYPRNAPNPLQEEMVLKGELEPTNEGYAIAKVAVTKLCEYLSREDATYQYKTLIPCNLYGRWDKFEPAHSHMIPAVIRKIHEATVQEQSEVKIWGDGEARREFLYAGDLADMVMLGIDRFDDLPGLMNVGLSTDYSINEYYEAIARVIGFSGKFTHDLSKPVGMKQKLVDVSRQTTFKWKPNNTLEEGIKKSYEFYLSQVILS